MFSSKTVDNPCIFISLAHSALILALRNLQLLSGQNAYLFRHHFCKLDNDCPTQTTPHRMIHNQGGTDNTQTL